MVNAIVKVFPETKHRLCVWHTYQNAAKNLNRVFHEQDQFGMDFGKCVYDHEEEKYWLLAWSKMVNMHKLTENKWLKNLFETKEKWAMVYYAILLQLIWWAHNETNVWIVFWKDTWSTCLYSTSTFFSIYLFELKHWQFLCFSFGHSKTLEKIAVFY